MYGACVCHAVSSLSGRDFWLAADCWCPAPFFLLSLLPSFWVLPLSLPPSLPPSLPSLTLFVSFLCLAAEAGENEAKILKLKEKVLPLLSLFSLSSLPSLSPLSPLSPITSLTLWLEDLAGAHVDAVYALYALRLYIRWTVASSPVALWHGPRSLVALWYFRTSYNTTL